MAATVLSDAERVAWLRLIRTENVGPQSFRQLLGRFGSAGAALDALPGLSRRLGAASRIPSVAEAEDEIAALGRLGGRMVALGEADYPPLLQHIPAAAAASVIGGGLRLLRTVAIVGRNASAAGQKMTRLLAGDLGDAGYTVVSGLARGSTRRRTRRASARVPWRRWRAAWTASIRRKTSPWRGRSWSAVGC